MANEEDSNAMWQRAFDQFLNDWIGPEIKRRQEAGLLPIPVVLQKFQIIWYPPPRLHEIRINGEVRGELEVKVKEGKAWAQGEKVFTDDIESVNAINLAEDEDQDCGHVTFFRLRDRWFGSFDAIYNKGLASTYLKRGEEFLAVAKHAMANNMINAFIDNLFSAAELFAKARLLLLTEFRFRTKTDHGNTAGRLNFHAHLGNISAEQKDAFNELSRLRYPARYVDQGDVIIPPSKASELLAGVESMREDIVKLINWRKR